MTSDLLSLATTALRANQTALQTVGQNIANVNTPGYSRQSVVLQSAGGVFSGGGYIGQGVAVNTVMRNYSDFLSQQSNVAAAQQASDTTLSTQLTQLENVFPSGANGLGASVSTMLNSFSDVASAPQDLTARTVALANANQMAAQFRASSASLDSLQSGAQTQLEQSVVAINSLATQIASANDKVARATGSGQTPNDLLDQRDQLISQLNQYVQTTSIPNTDGSINLFLAGSQALVVGKDSNSLSVSSGGFPGDGSIKTLTIKQSGLSMPMDESNLGGGSVKGLVSFLNQGLTEGRNLLGRMALTIGTVVNTQHQLGLDMKGNPGGNLFQMPPLPAGLPASTNTGTGTLSMSVSDPTALSASNYQVTYSSATAGSVTRMSDGQTTAFDFNTPPVQVDGLTLSATAGAAAGDRFLLKPFATVAGQIDTAFSSPTNLAVASRIQASVGSSNTGGLGVTSLQAKSPDANLTQPVTLSFDASTGTYTASGTGTGLPATAAYTPGQPISFNGWSLTLSGVPKTGDTLTVGASNPAYASTNSGNAAAIMNLRDMAVFDGSTLTDGYAAAMAQVGVRAQSAGFAATTSTAIATNAQTAQASVSGVNLDEEAAKLLQYQQSYQAAAKMMQIAQTVFSTLISAFGP